MICFDLDGTLYTEDDNNDRNPKWTEGKDKFAITKEQLDELRNRYKYVKLVVATGSRLSPEFAKTDFAKSFDLVIGTKTGSSQSETDNSKFWNDEPLGDMDATVAAKTADKGKLKLPHVERAMKEFNMEGALGLNIVIIDDYFEKPPVGTKRNPGEPNPIKEFYEMKNNDSKTKSCRIVLYESVKEFLNAINPKTVEYTFHKPDQTDNSQIQDSTLDTGESLKIVGVLDIIDKTNKIVLGFAGDCGPERALLQELNKLSVNPNKIIVFDISHHDSCAFADIFQEAELEKVSFLVPKFIRNQPNVDAALTNINNFRNEICIKNSLLHQIDDKTLVICIHPQFVSEDKQELSPIDLLRKQCQKRSATYIEGRRQTENANVLNLYKLESTSSSDDTQVPDLRPETITENMQKIINRVKSISKESLPNSQGSSNTVYVQCVTENEGNEECLALRVAGGLISKEGETILQLDNVYAAEKKIRELLGDDLETYTTLIKDFNNSYLRNNELNIQIGGEKHRVYGVYRSFPDAMSLKEVLRKYPGRISDKRQQNIHKLQKFLKILHENKVYHRDFKAGNVIVDKEGDVYVTDFDEMYSDSCILSKFLRDELLLKLITSQEIQDIASKQATNITDLLPDILFDLQSSVKNRAFLTYFDNFKEKINENKNKSNRDFFLPHIEAYVDLLHSIFVLNHSKFSDIETEKCNERTRDNKFKQYQDERGMFEIVIAHYVAHTLR